MSNTVIRVENLSKKYLLGSQKQERYTALRDVIANRAKALFQTPNSKSPSDEFWALKDISFEIKQGDRVGIIGRNGAGKSTLLKVLSRITEPTTGSIRIRGRVASLLEVGTGFHPELTGRENIFLNGAILGMGKAEIQRKFDEIVAFAEVEKFLDTPVKRYSSGMYVRLAFAVAAHMEPEILIVDEVLAVGDVKFQKKCIGKMEEVGREGRTVLFVSHNLGILQSLCTRGILLAQGQLLADDRAAVTVSNYLKLLEQASTQNLLERTDRRGKGEVRLTNVEVSMSEDLPSTILRTGYPARFIFHVTDLHLGITCVFTIYDQQGQAIVHFSSAMRSDDDLNDPDLGNKIVCEIDELLLIPGRYRINVALMSNGELQDHVEGAAILEVEQGKLRERPVTTEFGYGNVCLPHRWILSA